MIPHVAKRPIEEIDWVDTCPLCGRILVVCYYDDKFDLSAKATTTVGAVVGPDETGHFRPEQGAGRCLRLRCRLKQWLSAR